MNAAQQTGTLADVLAARRALMAVYEPPYLISIGTVVYAATVAVYLAAATFGNFPVSIAANVCVLVELIAFICWSVPRARLARPRRFRLFAPRAYVAIGVIAALGFAALIGALVVGFAQRGSVLAGVGVFVVLVAMMFGVAAVRWRMDPYGADIAALRAVSDQPAVCDPVIGVREALMVGAVLAGPACVDVRLLTRALRCSDQELGAHTAGLVAAHYISIYPDRGRWWFGFTHTGRTVYRRHLRALLQPPQAPVQAWDLGCGIGAAS